MEKSIATELSVQGEGIQQLYNEYTMKKFLVNRRYQRKLVWSVDEKERLIDSVANNLPIPLILLAESSGDHSGRLEVIDGLQRLNTVFSFIENEFSLNGEYFDLATLADTKLQLDEGKIAQKEPILERDTCRNIANYQLPVSVYRSASDESVDEVFRRINSSGRHLSPHEIRQAGATQKIAELVRKISSVVRRDASLTDYVPLSDMAKISITSNDLNYGIYVEEIFWVKQGILTRESVRESRDEELVLDILLDLALERPAATGLRYRDSAYGIENDRSVTSADVVNRRISVIGEEELEERFISTLEVLRSLLEKSTKPFAALTVTQQNYRGVPRHFQAIFVAISQLLYDESREVASEEDLLGKLWGFWDEDLRIPSGGGDWGSERKVQILEMAKARLRPAFRLRRDPQKSYVKDHTVRFETSLSMALTEDSLFELKQGFCRIDNTGNFDDNSFSKILRTASAMANKGPNANGVIFIGVADNEHAASLISRNSGVSSLIYEGFHITGTQHELASMNKTLDVLWRELTRKIRNSLLESDFAENIARSLVPFRYQGYLIWKIESVAIGRPVTYDNRFYDRVGPETTEAAGKYILEIGKRFH